MTEIKNIIDAAESNKPVFKGADHLFFTDRTEHIKNFDEFVSVIKDNKQKHATMYFWGRGGYGKSTLLRHLYEKEEDHNICKIYIDLEKKDRVDILCTLRKMIGDHFKDFNFTLFDLAIAKYETFVGKKISIEKKKDDNFLVKIGEYSINCLSDIGKYIPNDDVFLKAIAPGTVQFIDTYKDFKTLREAINKKIKDEISKALNRDALMMLESYNNDNDIKSNLHSFFAVDLNYNLKTYNNSSKDYPLVILLDTLESLVNIDRVNSELSDVNIGWLIGRTGLINTIGGVVWVISGREDIFPEDNKKAIISYCLDAFANEDDCVKLLNKYGIKDKEMLDTIIRITKRVPIYLSLCGETYKNNNNATEKDFEEYKDDLVNVYIKYLSEMDKEVIRLMALQDEFILDYFKNDLKYIYGEVKGTELVSSYDRITTSTLIHQIDDTRYKLPEIVAKGINDDKDFNDDLKKLLTTKLFDLWLDKDDRVNFDTDEFIDDGFYYSDRISFLVTNNVKDTNHLKCLLQIYCNKEIENFSILINAGRSLLQLVQEHKNEFNTKEDKKLIIKTMSKLYYNACLFGCYYLLFDSTTLPNAIINGIDEMLESAEPDDENKDDYLAVLVSKKWILQHIIEEHLDEKITIDDLIETDNQIEMITSKHNLKESFTYVEYLASIIKFNDYSLYDNIKREQILDLLSDAKKGIDDYNREKYGVEDYEVPGINFASIDLANEYYSIKNFEKAEINYKKRFSESFSIEDIERKDDLRYMICLHRLNKFDEEISFIDVSCDKIRKHIHYLETADKETEEYQFWSSIINVGEKDLLTRQARKAVALSKSNDKKKMKEALELSLENEKKCDSYYEEGTKKHTYFHTWPAKMYFKLDDFSRALQILTKYEHMFNKLPFTQEEKEEYSQILKICQEKHSDSDRNEASI